MLNVSTGDAINEPFAEIGFFFVDVVVMDAFLRCFWSLLWSIPNDLVLFTSFHALDFRII